MVSDQFPWAIHGHAWGVSPKGPLVRHAPRRLCRPCAAFGRIVWPLKSRHTRTIPKPIVSRQTFDRHRSPPGARGPARAGQRGTRPGRQRDPGASPGGAGGVHTRSLHTLSRTSSTPKRPGWSRSQVGVEDLRDQSGRQENGVDPSAAQNGRIETRACAFFHAGRTVRLPSACWGERPPDVCACRARGVA